MLQDNTFNQGLEEYIEPQSLLKQLYNMGVPIKKYVALERYKSVVFVWL